MARFLLLVCIASWLALPANPCFAGETAPEKPIRGPVLGAHGIVEYGFLERDDRLWTYGGGGFVGYRSGRLVAGIDVTASSSIVSRAPSPYPYDGSISYEDVSFYPTLQAAFYQSREKHVEAFIQAAIYMSRHKEVVTYPSPNSSQDTITTTYYGRIGYRLGLGARVWFTRHFAANLVGVVGHTVVIDDRRPAVLGVGLMPGLFVMF